MKDLLKNFLYTGVGLVALASEKLQTVVDDLVEQGKLSQEEGKKIVDDFFKTSEAKRDELESKVRKMTEGFTGKLDIFSKDGVSTMRDRIEELEDKLSQSEPTKAVKQTVQKVVASATKSVEPKEVKKNIRKKTV